MPNDCAPAGNRPSPPPGWESWEAVMRLAMDEAKKAEERGEVPVGAVVLDKDGRVLALAGNESVGTDDPSAHAEMAAVRRACLAIGNYRLDKAVVAVTLEPCLMCVGALAHARAGVVVYGAPDPKSGAVDSCLEGFALPFLNHRPKVVAGVLAEECGDMLRAFFRARRGKPHGRPEAVADGCGEPAGSDSREAVTEAAGD